MLTLALVTQPDSRSATIACEFDDRSRYRNTGGLFLSHEQRPRREPEEPEEPEEGEDGGDNTVIRSRPMPLPQRCRPRGSAT